MHIWKMLTELTDQNVLGSGGLSCEAPVEKARAILVNEAAQYAVMHEKATNLYMLPGGGIEDGEDAEAAITREILEETGCSCDSIIPLGIISENRFHANCTRLSYFFVIHTSTKQAIPCFTREERELGTEVKWVSLDELLHLIRDCECGSENRKFLQARDLAALQEYIKRF